MAKPIEIEFKMGFTIKTAEFENVRLEYGEKHQLTDGEDVSAARQNLVKVVSKIAKALEEQTRTQRCGND
mgnify:CR=1 FL=1